MNKIFDNGIFIKVVSVFVAIVVWAFIMGYEDPVDTRVLGPFTADLDLERSLPVTLGYSVLEGASEKILVEVRGKRTDLIRMNESDVKVSANIDSLTRAGTFNLPIEVQSLNSNITISKVTPSRLMLRLDKLVPKSFTLRAEVGGTTASGYMFGSVSVTPQILSATGPETDMNAVNHALALVNAEGVDKSFSLEVPLLLINKSGEQIVSPHIKKAMETAVVSVQVLKRKTVPVRVNVTNDLGLNLSNLFIEYSMPSLTLTSEGDAVDAVSEIVLGQVTATELMSGVDRDFALALPPGVASVDRVQKIHVKAKADMTNQRVFEVTGIEVKNLPEGYVHSLETSSLPVVVTGPQTVLDSLTAEEIKLVLDMEGRDFVQGVSSYLANVELPDPSVSVSGQYYVRLSITGPEE